MKFDGAAFIPDVIRGGAAVIVTEKSEDELSEIIEADMTARGEFEELLTDNVTIVRVPSVRYAMGVISSRYYGEPSKHLTVIGITGTKGKTTTTYMIREMLSRAGHRCGLVGTIEIDDGKETVPSANTTPESIVLHKKFKDMVDNGLDSVVMEVSSQGLKLDRVAGVDFDYGIFTNLSPDHIGPGEHDDYDDYKNCKKKLFSMCKTGIFNMDDPEAEFMMQGATCDKVLFGKGDGETFDNDENTQTTDGSNHAPAYIAVGHKLYMEDGLLGISYKLTGKLTADIKVDLPGDFSIYNSLAAIAVADLMGVGIDDIAEILKSIKVRGRVEMIPISDKFTLMIDYAHNGVSLKSLLLALREYNPPMLITLFGCGGDRARSRRYDMGEVSGTYSDFTIITSDNPRTEDPQAIMDDIKQAVEKTDGDYIDIIDRKEAIRYAIMNAREGDVIVLAGKGHEDYQEINGVKYHMDERDLIREILEEEDVTKICGYNNRYFA